MFCEVPGLLLLLLLFFFFYLLLLLLFFFFFVISARQLTRVHFLHSFFLKCCLHSLIEFKEYKILACNPLKASKTLEKEQKQTKSRKHTNKKIIKTIQAILQYQQKTNKTVLRESWWRGPYFLKSLVMYCSFFETRGVLA